MKKNRFAALILALPLAALSLAACSGGSGSWDGYEAQYIKSCTTSASGSGLDDEKVNSYCECTFKGIKENYTLDEAKELDKLAGKDQAAALEKLSGTIKACTSHLQ